MTDKTDMTLEIQVAVSGHVDQSGAIAANAVYKQTGSNPRSSGVVDREGVIDLTKMDFDCDKYNCRTDIIINLTGGLTDANGGRIEVTFPSDPQQAVSIIPPEGGSQTEIVPVSGGNPCQLILDDRDDDSQTYDYCLKPVAVLSSGSRSFQLDPRIINR